LTGLLTLLGDAAMGILITEPPAVLWRKGSFGCVSNGGCRFVGRMLTVVQTLRLQQRSVLAYLEEALRAHRNDLPAPKLLPTG
jgi:transposase